MSEIEKPLHVRVAEALGWHAVEWWTEFTPRAEPYTLWTYGVPAPGSMRMPVPRFDTDWSATGPLIERYHLGLIYAVDKHQLGTTPFAWLAYTHDNDWVADYSIDVQANGEWASAPLVAICNLILILSKAGKLKATS